MQALSIPATCYCTRNVLIIGAGEMAVQLALRLDSENVEVKIIARRREKCIRAAQRLKRTTVIHGDPADKKLLLEERLESMDAVIAMTPSEEFNILAALVARTYEIPKVTAVLYRNVLKPMVETVGSHRELRGCLLRIHVRSHDHRRHRTAY